jgi:hypothetical protein
MKFISSHILHIYKICTKMDACIQKSANYNDIHVHFVLYKV